jgi:hypothetical protein
MMEQVPAVDEIESSRLQVVDQEIRLTDFDTRLVCNEARVDIDSDHVTASGRVWLRSLASVARTFNRSGTSLRRNPITG